MLSRYCIIHFATCAAPSRLHYIWPAFLILGWQNNIGTQAAAIGALHRAFIWQELARLVTPFQIVPSAGGLVAGWQTPGGRSVEVGIHGFWRPYFNIFALVAELGLEPFTAWTASHQYSPRGLEVAAAILAVT